MISRQNLNSPSLLFFLLFALSLPCFAGAPRTKTDIVYMRNGDKITCEVKSLSKGQLTVGVDYTKDNVVIDWTKVAHVESTQQFIVTDPQGKISYGSLTGDENEKTVTVKVTESAPVTIAQNSVVEIDELGTSFFRRMRGNISVGTTIAQANSQSTLAAQSSVTYQSEKYVDTFSWNSQFITQKNASNTAETTVNSSVFRQLKRSNWYGGGLANFLSSSAQQISLQSIYGGALARRLIYTNKTNFTAIGGLGYTVQQNSSASAQPGTTHALDSAFALQYATFRFDKVNFNTTVWAYPGLTEPGRIRMTFNQDVYYKFLGNLYISFNFYDNYDNRPVLGAPSNNLGTSTTIGWSFP
jgi:hypothetical protein